MVAAALVGGKSEFKTLVELTSPLRTEDYTANFSHKNPTNVDLETGVDRCRNWDSHVMQGQFQREITMGFHRPGNIDKIRMMAQEINNTCDLSGV